MTDARLDHKRFPLTWRRPWRSETETGATEAFSFPRTTTTGVRPNPWPQISESTTTTTSLSPPPLPRSQHDQPLTNQPTDQPTKMSTSVSPTNATGGGVDSSTAVMMVTDPSMDDTTTTTTHPTTDANVANAKTPSAATQPTPTHHHHHHHHHQVPPPPAALVQPPPPSTSNPVTLDPAVTPAGAGAAGAGAPANPSMGGSNHNEPLAGNIPHTAGKIHATNSNYYPLPTSGKLDQYSQPRIFNFPPPPRIQKNHPRSTRVSVVPVARPSLTFHHVASSLLLLETLSPLLSPSAHLVPQWMRRASGNGTCA